MDAGGKTTMSQPGKLTRESPLLGLGPAYRDVLEPQLSKDGGRWSRDPLPSLISQNTCHLETKPPLFYIWCGKYLGLRSYQAVKSRRKQLLREDE